MSWLPDLYGQLFGRNAMSNGTIIDMAEHGRAGGVSTGQPFKFTDGVPMALKITTSGSSTYIALANPGTTEATDAWQVRKLLNSGSDITITWANGDTLFDNVATDLTELIYG